MRTAAPPLQGALIGCGYVSRFHLEGWARVSSGALLALCDLDRQRLQQASTRVPGARLYTDAAGLFQSEQELDFVEICTRPDSHRALVELAARGSPRTVPEASRRCAARSGRNDYGLRFGRHSPHVSRELAVSTLVSCTPGRDRGWGDWQADSPADRASRHPGLAPEGTTSSPTSARCPA